MREPDRDPGRLDHMLSAIDLLMEEGLSLSLEELKSDRLRYYGIVKNIEIIGEAANLLTTAFTESHPEINWRRIIAMRHVLVHDYYNILPEEIWNVLQFDLPELREQLIAIKEDLPGCRGI